MSISIDPSGGPVWAAPAPGPAPQLPTSGLKPAAPPPAVTVDIGGPKTAPVVTYDRLITSPMPNPAPEPATPPTPVVLVRGR